jgi:dihydrolipoamide dehydrogenase
MVVGSMIVETDVVIIGAGPGGYVAAIRAAQLGKDVIVVEQEKHVGGICLNHGCIPTKAIIHASDYYNAIHNLEYMGVTIHDYSFDPCKMMEWKEGILDKLRKGIGGLFEKYGIEVIEGKGVFTDEHTLHVEGKSDVNAIKFKNAVIATGSLPIEIPGFEFDGETVMSSRHALSLCEVPKKLVIIGGGYIGTEMGTVYGKLGSEVHILEMQEHIISVMDQEIVDVVAKKLQEFNIHVHTNTKAISIEKKDGRAVVSIEEQGNKKTIDADKVFVVVGRRPNSAPVDPAKAGIKVDDHGFIIVDAQQRTSMPHIFAIGDVVGQPMLAHKANREGKIAAEVIAGLPSAFDNKVIPSVVFNDPELASVGLTKEQAEEKGYEVKIGKFPFAALGRALTLNQTDGFVKIIADAKNDLVLGVHAVGVGASDIIGEATLAIEMGATLEDIGSTIHVHPTLPESLMEAAEAAMGTAIHIFNPKKK